MKLIHLALGIVQVSVKSSSDLWTKFSVITQTCATVVTACTAVFIFLQTRSIREQVATSKNQAQASERQVLASEKLLELEVNRSQQSNFVSGWLEAEPYPWTPRGSKNTLYRLNISINISNLSDQPVYTVVYHVRFETDPTSINYAETEPVVIPVLPPNKLVIKKLDPESDFLPSQTVWETEAKGQEIADNLPAICGIEFSFRDSSGLDWLRKFDGSLAQMTKVD